MNPAKLIEQWREAYEHAVYEGKLFARNGDIDATARAIGGQDALAACLNGLRSAYRRHPMTEEPVGGEGVEVCLFPEDEDRTYADWDADCSAWSCDMFVRDCLSWGEIRDRYPHATWCYLPPRGDHG